MTSRPPTTTLSCSPCSAFASRRTVTTVNHSHTIVASTLVGCTPRTQASTSSLRNAPQHTARPPSFCLS
jgi:hypothetical protein